MFKEIQQHIEACAICSTHADYPPAEPQIIAPVPGTSWLQVVTDLLLVLYSRNTNISRNIIKHNVRTSMNQRTHFFSKYISHTLFSKGWCLLCVRDELETGIYCYIDSSSSREHSSTSSSSWLGLLDRWSLRAQSPVSAAGSHFDVWSPTDPNRLCTWLYYCLTPTYFRCSSTYLHRCISWLTAQSRVNI